MRVLGAILLAGGFILLLVLTIKVAGIDRSLRRIEHEQRRRNVVVWYLMTSPRMAIVAPLSQWMIVQTSPTQKECEATRHRRLAGHPVSFGFFGMPTPIDIIPRERCIASDDPRLRE